jgi:hypothetical protein
MADALIIDHFIEKLGVSHGKSVSDRDEVDFLCPLSVQ